MSLHDYQISKQLVQDDPPFVALIMAAYRKADTHNALLLAQAFPKICIELQVRYESPGGIIHGDPEWLA
jgi:hypothetical protein